MSTKPYDARATHRPTPVVHRQPTTVSQVFAQVVRSHGIDREIWRLSAATFVALVSEPLLLLADTAIVGHLGTTQLAGLGIASAVLGGVVSLCIFLAYGTTGAVARLIGAGQRTRALTQGVDGVWLAFLIGAVVSTLGLLLNRPLIGLFGPGPAVADQAADYLRVAWWGVLPMLVVLAAVGVLRGISDVRTPMLVAVTGNLVNVAANLLLVYGLDLGIAGSALGTTLVQLASALVLVAVLVRHARAAGARLSPDLRGIREAGRAGVPLLVRTLLLRAALLVMTWSAASYGEGELATMQLALTIWTFLAFALDALGISAQTLVGQRLGARDVAGARSLTRRLIAWGVGYGVLTGVLLAIAGGWLGPLFTSDSRVVDLLRPVLLVAAIAQPVAGVVFVLDGILIGAGDTTYLAWGHAAVLAVFAPVALMTGSLTPLWICFGALFMGGRAVMLLFRARGEAWTSAATRRAAAA